MDRDLARAEHLLEVGHAQQAEQLLRTALATDPESAAALCMLAQALLSQSREREALEVAKRAVAIDPDNEHAHRLRSIALKAFGYDTAAVESARVAARLAPWMWQTHYTLGSALRGHWTTRREALEEAREAVRLAPREPAAHNLVGLCYHDLDRPDEAEAAYTEALRADPEYALAINNLAALRINSGSLSKASSLLRSGLNSDPQEKVLQQNYDTVLLRLVRRLYIALLATVIGVILLGAADVGRVGRSVAVGVLLAIYLSATYWVTRNLPRGSHLWNRGLLRRLTWQGRVLVVAFVLLTIGAVLLAVVPRHLDPSPLLTGVLAFRLLVIAALAATAASRLRSRVRKDLRNNSAWPRRY